jgi:hypothetical protein
LLVAGKYLSRLQASGLCRLHSSPAASWLERVPVPDGSPVRRGCDACCRLLVLGQNRALDEFITKHAVGQPGIGGEDAEESSCRLTIYMPQDSRRWLS